MPGRFVALEQWQSTVSAEQSCKFGTVVRALWPSNTAAHLAQRLGCSKRGAQYLIDGERRVTARALAVIIAEVID